MRLRSRLAPLLLVSVFSASVAPVVDAQPAPPAAAKPAKSESKDKAAGAKDKKDPPDTKEKPKPEEDAPDEKEKKAEAPTVPPDVVRKKDGGLIRGTIVEKVPGKHVEITLTNGETRKIPMSEVEWAGPVAEAPTKTADTRPPPAPPPKPPMVPANVPLVSGGSEVSFSTPGPGVTVYYKSGSADISGSGWVWGKNGGWGTYSGTATSFTRLCTAPCRAQLPGGTYKFGLSLDDDKVVEADDAISVSDGSRLRATYNDKSGVRTAGWVTMVGGGIAGLVLVATGMRDVCNNGTTTDRYGQDQCLAPDKELTTGGKIGSVIFFGSIITGIVLVLQKDSAQLTRGAD